MDWTQAFTIIGITVALFVFMMNRMDANQKQNNDRFNSLENRMTAIEVEIKNINQRLSTIENCLMPRKVFRFEEPDHKDEPKEN